MALFDTNVLVDIGGGGGRRLQAAARNVFAAKQAAGDALATSRINEAELRVGVARARDRAVELQRVEAVLRRLTILDFDATCAARLGEIKGKLMDLGRPSGDLDLLIAAVALVYGQTLVTRNPKHFADVPGLAVESY